MTDDTESIQQRVSVELFDLDSQVSEFQCGKESLDDFINTEQAWTFHKRRLGRTKLVYWEGDLAGYYTLAPNALTDDEYEAKRQNTPRSCTINTSRSPRSFSDA